MIHPLSSFLKLSLIFRYGVAVTGVMLGLVLFGGWSAPGGIVVVLPVQTTGFCASVANMQGATIEEDRNEFLSGQPKRCKLKYSWGTLVIEEYISAQARDERALGWMIISGKRDSPLAQGYSVGEKSSEGVVTFGDCISEVTPPNKVIFKCKYSYHVAFQRGCYLIKAESNNTDYTQEVTRAIIDPLRGATTGLDNTLKTKPVCFGLGQPPAQPPAGQPPVQPLAAAPIFGVGHGCAYNETKVTQPGQVRCAAMYTNAPQGATVSYRWTLDGTQQPEKGSSFTRADKDLSPGEHTLVVVAAVEKAAPPKEASSTYKFTKAGAGLSVTVLCALRSDENRTVACFADAKNASPGETLTYEWTWNGAREGETSRALNKRDLPDGVYSVQVRAKDSRGNYTPMVSSSIKVGSPAGLTNLIPPAALEALNSLLTGQPSPNPPDPGAVAAAATAAAAALGLGALLNALLNAAGAAGAGGAVRAVGTPPPGSSPQPAGPKPVSLPGISASSTGVSPGGKPTSLPGQVRIEGSTTPSTTPKPATTNPEADLEQDLVKDLVKDLTPDKTPVKPAAGRKMTGAGDETRTGPREGEKTDSSLKPEGESPKSPPSTASPPAAPPKPEKPNALVEEVLQGFIWDAESFSNLASHDHPAQHPQPPNPAIPPTPQEQLQFFTTEMGEVDWGEKRSGNQEIPITPGEGPAELVNELKAQVDRAKLLDNLEKLQSRCNIELQEAMKNQNDANQLMEDIRNRLLSLQQGTPEYNTTFNQFVSAMKSRQHFETQVDQLLSSIKSIQESSKNLDSGAGV